jgi:hypothetical protein
MKPTPRRMPHLTAGLQVGGMSLFILAGYLPSPVGRPVAWIGVVLFGLGLVVALVGLVWSVWTLTSPALRRRCGVATPVATILIALLAWLGAWLTVHKFRQSRDVLPGRADERAARGAAAGPE